MPSVQSFFLNISCKHAIHNLGDMAIRYVTPFCIGTFFVSMVRTDRCTAYIYLPEFHSGYPQYPVDILHLTLQPFN